jgi:hypothetical protein
MMWLRQGAAVELGPECVQPVSRARNQCILNFLETDHDYLWFIDSDTTPPPHALQALVAADCDAISGVVHVRKRDLDDIVKSVPMVLRGPPEAYKPVLEGRGVEPIDASGAACLMLSRTLIEKLPFPVFHEPTWEKPMGEDMIFTGSLQADHGVQLFAHFGVICQHRKEVDF